MKKNLILPILLLLSTLSFSQDKSDKNKPVVCTSSVSKKDSSSFYKKDHSRFKDSLMKMILDKKDDVIVEEICKSNNFSSVLVFWGKNAERLTEGSDIKGILEIYRKSLPNDVKIKPDFVNEELDNGDFIRHEIWYIKGNSVKDRKMVVQFVNGTITNFLISFD